LESSSVVKLTGRKRTKVFFPTLATALTAIGLAAHAAPAAMAETNSPLVTGIWLVDSQPSQVPQTITGNPAVENVFPGTGLAGRLLQLPEKKGLRLGGLWLADSNDVFSGGKQPGEWTWNSALIIGANLDAERLLSWKGASFGAQFLQFNGQDTNGKAGSVQGFNSLPGPPPLDRSELYQLWYRQSLIDDKFIFRIGKIVPTYDFNNVARPVPTHDETLDIPAVTGLLYTPVFVNPTLLGAIGGYYNSVCGLTLTLAPTRNTYLNYGIYDGNVARGVQTGLTGPHFNGYYFNIWEAGVDWVAAGKYPGQFGVGGWYQTGVLHGKPGVSQHGTGGGYFFGSQRIWSSQVEPAARDGHRASVSMFVQFGANNSNTLPVKDYFGWGLTGFDLIPFRPDDSVGVGMAQSWLNPHSFKRPSELMFQSYYQAHLYGGTFFQPALSYIPTPGASPSIPSAWAVTLRFTLLF
jgi:porin